MKTLISIFLLLIFAAFSGNVSAQTNERPQEKEFAQKALAKYVSEFLTEENISKYGFESLNEAKSAKVGEPLPIMIISLRELKKAQEGSFKTLLNNVNTLWFPVMVNGQVRAKIEIVQKDKTWIAAEFGNMKSSRLIADVYGSMPKMLKEKNFKEPYKLSLVKVLSLGAYFILADTNDGQFLTPAFSQPQLYKLEKGKLYTADEVLKRLRDAAKEIDENKIM